MSNEANFEYLNSIREEYRKSNRPRKSLLLEHAVRVTGLSRKWLIRILSSNSTTPRRQTRGRPSVYRAEILEHLKRIWLFMEQPCGKRLKPILARVLPKYRTRYPDLSDEIASQLLSISPATIDRMLKVIRAHRGICTTKAPSSQWYKSVVPVQPKDWNITQPGHFQADTVSHCGEDASGAFASTLTMTDIDSHWTELRAVWTKHHSGIISAIRDIEKSSHFTVNSINFDSGSEFMNYGVINFCRSFGPAFGRQSPIRVTRSRPYRKNDNCYVEQKNLTHVRQFIGYDRIACPEVTRLLNQIYRELWSPFLNFFMPSFKMLRKERIGSRIVKTYEPARTPYEQLMESSAVSAERKQLLLATYEGFDPFELKQKIEESLKLLFQMIRQTKKTD